MEMEGYQSSLRESCGSIFYYHRDFRVPLNFLGPTSTIPRSLTLSEVHSIRSYQDFGHRSSLLRACSRLYSSKVCAIYGIPRRSCLRALHRPHHPDRFEGSPCLYVRRMRKPLCCGRGQDKNRVSLSRYTRKYHLPPFQVFHGSLARVICKCAWQPRKFPRRQMRDRHLSYSYAYYGRCAQDCTFQPCMPG